MDNDAIQTDSPPLRTSVGVQVGVEQDDVGVEALPQVTSRGVQAGVERQDAQGQTEMFEERVFSAPPSRTSMLEDASESFESWPLKPKYLSSPALSEEENEDRASSESSGTLRQRYSIIQPFMPSRKESEEE